MTSKEFMAIAFMCHRRPDRSFFFRGKQFPICARCTGIMIGYVIGIIIAIATKCDNYLYYLLLHIPMIIDGGVQRLFNIESTNARRLVTGILGGIAVIYSFISFHMFSLFIAETILYAIHN